MHTRVLFRVNASKGVSKINIWQDLNVRFGSAAVGGQSNTWAAGSGQEQAFRTASAVSCYPVPSK
jgi:hypothetical protein